MNSDPNTASLIKQIFMLIQSIIPAYAMCLMSEELTDRLKSLDFYNEIDWYNLPFNVRCVLPFIIMHTQNPFIVELYGNNSCNCETFKKVIFVKTFSK